VGFTLKELSELIGAEYKGQEDTVLKSVASLDEAKQGDISFVSNPKYKKHLVGTNASAVILSATLAEDYAGNALIVKDPYISFAKVVNLFHPNEKIISKVHPSAIVDETALIGKNVNISANVVIASGVVIQDNVKVSAGCYIGSNSAVGENSHLYPNVSLYADTQVDKNAIIHSGAVIGADGFGFALQEDKTWYKIKQIGNVIIGDDVEIGANTTVDRAALGSTKLSNGVKLDNQVVIAHNVHIDEHVVIAGGTLIAGSSKVGKRCQIGGGVAIAGHLEIVDDVVITGRSMVIGSIKKPGVYSSGISTEENKKWRRNAARFRQLDDMAKKLNALEKKLKES
jgi:UDP-3-O-[3-hydroxymyristoyl] glucosamine N-acyltransferase